MSRDSSEGFLESPAALTAPRPGGSSPGSSFVCVATAAKTRPAPPQASANDRPRARDDVGRPIAGRFEDQGRRHRRSPTPVSAQNGVSTANTAFSETAFSGADAAAASPSSGPTSTVSSPHPGRDHGRGHFAATSPSKLSSPPSPPMSPTRVLNMARSPQQALRRQLSLPLASPDARRPRSLPVRLGSDAGVGTKASFYHPVNVVAEEEHEEEEYRSDETRDQDGIHCASSCPTDGGGEEDGDDDVGEMRTMDLDTAIETIRIIRREYVIFRMEDIATNLKTPFTTPGYVSLEYGDLESLEDHLNAIHRIVYGRDPSADAGPIPGRNKDTTPLRAVIHGDAARHGGSGSASNRRRSARSPYNLSSPGPASSPLAHRQRPRPRSSARGMGDKGEKPLPQTNQPTTHTALPATPRNTRPAPASVAVPRRSSALESTQGDELATPVRSATASPTSRSPPSRTDVVESSLAASIRTPCTGRIDPTVAASPAVTTEVSELLVAEAEKLCKELSAVAKNLNDRRAESDHLMLILAEGREHDAGQIMELQMRVSELEEYGQEQESELAHLRLQLRAIDLQCLDCLPADSDPELRESIKNWKADFEAVRRRWQARRSRSRLSGVGDDLSSFMASTGTPTTSRTTATATTTPTTPLPHSPGRNVYFSGYR